MNLNCKIDDSSFNIIQGLGNGINDDVYLGVDNIGKVAVLKYIQSNHKAEVSFIREMGILIQSKHPCIVPFIGASFDSLNKSHQHSLCIVTEYMANDTLKSVYQKIKEGNIPDGWNATTRSKIAFGIAAGMEFLHNMQVYHLNLKPGSILLDSNFEPKIYNFGLTKINQNIDFFKYTPPEVLENPNTYTPTVFYDVYSFSILLCSLLNEGFPQFDSDEEIKSYKKAKQFILDNHRYKLSKNAPKKLIELIEQCWDSNMQKRKIFKEIVSLYRQSPESYCFEGTDIGEFKRYIDSIPDLKVTDSETNPSDIRSRDTGAGGRKKGPKKAGRLLKK